MFGLWKAYRGRRAAAAAITPFIDGTRLRLGDIPDSAWHDPYIIGFLGMLITVAATRLVGSFDTDTLAAVQAGAWTDITGMPGDVIGEEICFLGAANDARFLSGCSNAESFFQALDAASRQREQVLDTALRPPPVVEGAGHDVGSALWSRYFDAHLRGPLIAAEA
jgi:hypothetical protein